MLELRSSVYCEYCHLWMNRLTTYIREHSVCNFLVSIDSLPFCKEKGKIIKNRLQGGKSSLVTLTSLFSAFKYIQTTIGGKLLVPKSNLII